MFKYDLTIIIPSLSESDNLKKIIPEIKSKIGKKFSYEILIIDGMIKDNKTLQIAKKNSIKYLVLNSEVSILLFPFNSLKFDKFFSSIKNLFNNFSKFFLFKGSFLTCSTKFILPLFVFKQSISSSIIIGNKVFSGNLHSKHSSSKSSHSLHCAEHSIKIKIIKLMDSCFFVYSRIK